MIRKNFLIFFFKEIHINILISDIEKHRKRTIRRKLIKNCKKKAITLTTKRK